MVQGNLIIASVMCGSFAVRLLCRRSASTWPTVEFDVSGWCMPLGCRHLLVTRAYIYRTGLPSDADFPGTCTNHRHDNSPETGHQENPRTGHVLYIFLIFCKKLDLSLSPAALALGMPTLFFQNPCTISSTLVVVVAALSPKTSCNFPQFDYWYLVLLLTASEGEERRGEERRGEERRGQERTGQDRTGQDRIYFRIYFLGSIDLEGFGGWLLVDWGLNDDQKSNFWGASGFLIKLFYIYHIYHIYTR